MHNKTVMHKAIEIIASSQGLDQMLKKQLYIDKLYIFYKHACMYLTKMTKINFFIVLMFMKNKMKINLTFNFLSYPIDEFLAKS